MEQPDILEMMSALQLSGIRATYDDIIATAIKRKHGVKSVIGSLLQAELAEKGARSIRYQLGRRPQPPAVRALALLGRQPVCRAAPSCMMASDLHRS